MEKAYFDAITSESKYKTSVEALVKKKMLLSCLSVTSVSAATVGAPINSSYVTLSSETRRTACFPHTKTHTSPMIQISLRHHAKKYAISFKDLTQSSRI
jgi:hypothetical protein